MNKRILLKISGESLMGSSNFGIDVSTINYIAKEEYRNDFHILSSTTNSSELKAWLQKERFFISSEMGGVSLQNIEMIMADIDL